MICRGPLAFSEDYFSLGSSPDFSHLGVSLVLLSSFPFKIDAASFLSSKAAIRDLFPKDTTMLVTRQQSTSDGQEAGGAAPASPAAAASAAGGGAVAGSGGAGTEDGVGGGDGASGPPLVELKSFTTQIFFASWRALHLGLLQVRCGRALALSSICLAQIYTTLHFMKRPFVKRPTACSVV